MAKRGPLLAALAALLVAVALAEPLVVNPFAAISRSAPSEAPFVPRIVPLPQNYTLGECTVTLMPDTFHMKSGAAGSRILRHALHRYHDLIFDHRPSSLVKPSIVLPGLTVQVQSEDESLQLNTDESYKLTVPCSGSSDVMLQSATVHGAIRGLETLSQLIKYNFETGHFEIANAPWSITDFPRFAHRGLLIDSSRHFQPVRVLKQLLDSMAHAKLNVLHWHMVDSQSFPYQSQALPLLSKSAYSPLEVYSIEDVQDVVQYAKYRGIRVVPEVDVPGHARAMCAGYPEICPSLSCTEPLDPSSQTTFDTISTLMQEMTDRAFFDGMFHLGGDEVDTSCWESTPHIAQWLAAKNYTVSDAYMYFVDKAHQIAHKLGRDSIHWEEVFNAFGTKLDPRIIIHVWLNSATLKKVVDSGYRGILSNGIWYLDHLGNTWDKLYLNEPLDGIDNPDSQKRVLGGEVCMWAETVDPSDLMSTVWPRAAAAAERLWSASTVRDLATAQPRMAHFRCLLARRGIGAAPLLNENARTAPPGPGGCLVQ